MTRQIHAGAGKVGVEPPETDGALFQLSQRADFCAEEASVDTLYRRPILNTRDEPHADPRRHRRLHIICGDANLSPFALWLKVGATALVLSLLEEGWQPPFALRKPVDAIKHSRATMSTRLVRRTTPDDLRRGCAEDLFGCRARARGWMLSRSIERSPPIGKRRSTWSATLLLADRLDWAAKRQLLEVS